MADNVEDLEQQLSAVARVLRDPAVLPDGTVVQRSTASLLRLLARDGPQRIGAVATAFRLDPSTTTRQVQQAAALGLVERSEDPRDRRVTVLALTAAGERAARAISSVQRDGLALIMQGWPEQDKTELTRLLGRFNESVVRLREQAAEQPGRD